VAEAIAGLARWLAEETTSSLRQPGSQRGSWSANPAAHVGTELLVAGMLIMAGGYDGKPLDYDELERWTRVGYKRGMRSRKGER
jgi:hypothetical protein